jgi:GNAT superfamily N-acetyltransferase
MRSHERSLPFQVVTEAGGRIVGSQLLVVREVKVGDRRLLCRMTHDFAVRPEYQRRGVLSAMRQMREDVLDREFDLMLGGLGRNPAVLRLRARIPQERVRFENEIVVLGRGQPIGELIRSPSKLLAYVQARARTWPALRNREAASGLRIRQVEGFDRRFDELWEDASSQFDFSMVRDSAYLNWRYADARAGLFTTWAAEADGLVLGFVVQRVSNGRGSIADLLVRPGRTDVARALVRQALDDLRRSGITRVEVWMIRRHEYLGALRDCGFHPVKRVTTLSCRALRVPMAWLDVLRDPRARVHVTLGDTDRI